jgi:hypothetical protein
MSTPANPKSDGSRDFVISHRGLGWGVLVSGAVSLVFAASMIVAVVQAADVISRVAAVVVLLFPAASLVSCAYAILSTTTFTRDETSWGFESRFGPWRHVLRLPVNEVVSVELDRVPRADVPFPSTAGWHIRIERNGGARPIRIGAGSNQPEPVFEEFLATLRADLAVRGRSG